MVPSVQFGGSGGGRGRGENFTYAPSISYNIIKRGDPRFALIGDVMKITKPNLKAHPFKSLWYRLTHYTVVMQWEGKESARYAKTYDEALAWARCYPADATVLIGKRGRLIASRF